MGRSVNLVLMLSFPSTRRIYLACELISFYLNAPIFPSKIISNSNLSADDKVILVTLWTGVLKRAESDPMTENLSVFLQVFGSIACPGTTVHSVLNLRFINTASK